MEANTNNLRLVQQEAQATNLEFNVQAAARAEGVMKALETVPGLHDGVGMEGSKAFANGVNIIGESAKTSDMQWKDTATLMKDDREGVQLERTLPLTGGGDLPASFVLRDLRSVENADGSITDQAMEYALLPGAKGGYEGVTSVRTAEGVQDVTLSNNEFMTQVTALMGKLESQTAQALDPQPPAEALQQVA